MSLLIPVIVILAVLADHGYCYPRLVVIGERAWAWQTENRRETD